MEHYLEQLIEDLHLITQGKPPKNVEETVHDEAAFYKHIENVENYIHGEQKPISAITGLMQEMLPPPEKLSEKQQAQLSVELEKFLRYFHFELDFPRGYPNHMRYPFIRDFWKEEHVPLSFGSSHIEFCNYEKENCPFPGYCTICEELEDEEDSELLKIPEKFEKLLNPIAQSIDCGQIVYINLDTMETEEVIPDMEDPEDFEINYGGCSWAQEPEFYKWEHTMRFEPLESHESFKIMEAFAEQMEDEKFKEQLFFSLNHKKPFANFKWKIDNSPYRQDWFDFKRKWLEGYVREIIWSKLNQNKNDY